MVPEALNILAPEERHRIYKMLRLNAIMYADGVVEIAGTFTGLLDVKPSNSVKTGSTSSSTVTSPTSPPDGFWITHRVEMTDERRATLEPKRRLGYDALGVLEGHLASSDFFVADRYSIADIALYAYTHVADEGGFDLDRFPAV